MPRALVILLLWPCSVACALAQTVSGAQAQLDPAAASAPVSAFTMASQARPAMQDPVSFAMLGQLLMGLVVVVIAILLVLWLIRRFTGLGAQGRHLKVVAALPLGTREKAVLIEIGGRQLLLGVAPGRVSLLERFDQPVVDIESGAGFGARLRDVLDRKDTP